VRSRSKPSSGGSDNDYGTWNEETLISKVLESITNHENAVYIAIVRYESESQGRSTI
jgi:hypothetical protein